VHAALAERNSPTLIPLSIPKRIPVPLRSQTDPTSDLILGSMWEGCGIDGGSMWEGCGINLGPASGINVGSNDQIIAFWDRKFRSHIDPTIMGGIDVGMMWDGSHIDPMKHVGLVWDSFGIDMGMMWEGSHTDPRIPVGLVWENPQARVGSMEDEHVKPQTDPRIYVYISKSLWVYTI
jgi:hypothetical protein